MRTEDWDAPITFSHKGSLSVDEILALLIVMPTQALQNLLLLPTEDGLTELYRLRERTKCLTAFEQALSECQ